MKSADDVRTRLNELACSGCHQARAIAGFHFPGADRADTAASNAVLLPGSPHFFGDQPRRLKILHRLAGGETLVRNDLAASYAARPLNKLQAELEGTELIGGWGGACLLEPTLTQSQRKWTCRAGLACAPLFKSANAPGLGTCAPKPDSAAGGATCVPKTGRQIGDAMQCGTVTTKAYGVDRYLRTDPPRQTPPEWTDRSNRKTLIPDERLPPGAPADNTYYAAHQEFFEGNDSDAQPKPLLFVNKRNAQTGGFPSGMLRLSECKGLPPEATCGLLAATGFNKCLTQVASGARKLGDCFVQRTAYSGVRACDAALPRRLHLPAADRLRRRQRACEVPAAPSRRRRPSRSRGFRPEGAGRRLARWQRRQGRSARAVHPTLFRLPAAPTATRRRTEAGGPCPGHVITGLVPVTSAG
jgi:hypothetical protein